MTWLSLAAPDVPAQTGEITRRPGRRSFDVGIVDPMSGQVDGEIGA
jgi:hypothetical protein